MVDGDGLSLSATRRGGISLIIHNTKPDGTDEPDRICIEWAFAG